MGGDLGVEVCGAGIEYYGTGIGWESLSFDSGKWFCKYSILQDSLA